MRRAAHYDGVAAGGAYESALFYSSEVYMQWLVAQCLPHIRGGADGAGGAVRRRLVDIGGGTGNFTARLAAAAGILPLDENETGWCSTARPMVGWGVNPHVHP